MHAGQRGTNLDFAEPCPGVGTYMLHTTIQVATNFSVGTYVPSPLSLPVPENKAGPMRCSSLLFPIADLQYVCN